MTLTQRMAKAAELSRVCEWEAEWDRAYAAMHDGTLDRDGFDLVHAGLRSARERYVVIMRALREANHA